MVACLPFMKTAWSSAHPTEAFQLIPTTTQRGAHVGDEDPESSERIKKS